MSKRPPTPSAPASPACPACGFSLIGLLGQKCPECGAILDDAAIDAALFAANPPPISRADRLKSATAAIALLIASAILAAMVYLHWDDPVYRMGRHRGIEVPNWLGMTLLVLVSVLNLGRAWVYARNAFRRGKRPSSPRR